MHRVVIDIRAKREIRSLPRDVRQRIVETLEHLQEEPRPPQCTKLIGIEGWRLRIGAYRVLYTIDDREGLVAIYRVSHRSTVYR